MCLLLAGCWGPAGRDSGKLGEPGEQEWQVLLPLSALGPLDGVSPRPCWGHLEWLWRTRNELPHPCGPQASVVRPGASDLRLPHLAVPQPPHMLIQNPLLHPHLSK